MLVYLADQADLSAAAALGDWNARGAGVVAALQAQASQTQAPLLDALRARGLAPRPYWIVNAIAVRGDQALAEWLANLQAVGVVAPNRVHTLEMEPASAAPDGQASPAWGLARIGVPDVWAIWGVRGAGTVVANLDTGVTLTHTALLGSYRGWSPTGLSHDYNWFDAVGVPPAASPIDVDGHGTHTMGTLVGGPAGSYSALGVAPQAKWIAVRACLGLFCSDEALLQGAQWILAPTDLAGRAPRPDLRPHIVSNSWGKLGDDTWYVGYVTAWNAAGIFSAFAAGNSGLLAGCGSSTTPGNYSASFSVGATDSEDEIADFSSRGPAGDGLLKPDVAAPGVAVPSAWPDGSVELLNGTSMAAPHVAGLAALLWSANPTLIGDLPATKTILTSSAMPIPTAECGLGGAAVPNNVYGWGRVNARQAVAAARVDVPWLAVPPRVSLPAYGSKTVEIALDARQVSAPGVYTARILVARAGGLLPIPVTFAVLAAPSTTLLTGRLTDHWQGSGVYGTVLIDPGPLVQTDSAGHFTATLPLSSYRLTASAHGYLSAATAISLTRPSAANLALMPNLPHVQAATPSISATLAFGERAQVPIAIANLGTQLLSMTAQVPPLEWALEINGEPGAALFDLSAMPAISLTDDMVHPEPLSLGFEVPINGMVVSQLYLSSNGWVSALPPGSPAPWAHCFPSASVPRGTLAPFWTDLDPSAGGAVRAGPIDGETYVVSFESVPLWQEAPSPEAPAFTFQLVLKASGQVEYRYGTMGSPPAQWSVGMGFDGQRGQGLACYKSPTELGGKLWRMHNQPLPGLWLTSTPTSVTVAPGTATTITAVLSGFGHVAWQPGPFSGVLRLTTNDPSQPALDLAASVIAGPPPHTLRFPLLRR